VFQGFPNSTDCTPTPNRRVSADFAVDVVEEPPEARQDVAPRFNTDVSIDRGKERQFRSATGVDMP
jgi:hypothetical protein